METPTTSWDETSPAGNSDLNLGDNRIREFKTQVREVISVDHEMDDAGSGDNWGKHNQVSLIEQADIGSGDEGLTKLGAQTISGKPELVYTDEDDNDIQITKNGKIFAGALGNLDETPTATSFPAAILKALYPVGTVYTNRTDSTNPGTLFGFGTWVAIAGRVIVGLDATQTEFDTAGEEGGAKTVTLDVTMIPAHTHTVDAQNDSNSGGTTIYKGAASAEPAEQVTSGSTGGGAAHPNLQPYVVCYVWYRSA